MLRQRKRELREGTWRHPRNRGIRFVKLVEEYRASQAYQILSPKTKRFYDQRIEVLLDEFGDTQVNSLNRRGVLKFRESRSKAVSDTTAYHEITTLFTILKWAARESIIPFVPLSTERLKPARAQMLTRTLEADEERRILVVAQPYQQAMIVAALDAGMHKKEIFGQTWKDVHLDQGIITMTASKKGREGRRVPLTRRLREVLESLPRTSEYVFTFKGERILTDTKKSWYRILKDAQVDAIRFHDLRATYGTRLEELNVPPAVAMALMGHKRKSAHDSYIRPTMPAMREAIAKLDSWLEANDLTVTAFSRPKGNVTKIRA
jgi:integrase